MKKIILTISLTVYLFAQSSLEIAKISYGITSGYQSSVSQLTMVLKNAEGIKNTRKLELKKFENNHGDKSLLTFLYPNDIKGTKLLSFDQIGENNKQWLYLPALKRIKRISSRNKSGSFMGSEFSYEDIASKNYKHYSYDEEAQKVIIDKQEYFSFTRVPKDKNSAYSKQIIYIDVKTYLETFGEYYDKNNRLLKKVSFLKYIKNGSVYRLHKIEIKNIQNLKSTTLLWDTDNINIGLSSKDFSKRVLK